MMRAHTKNGVNINRRPHMFAKGTYVLAVIIGTASGALAAGTQHSTAPNHDVYDVRGMYVGSDPDANVRYELRRDQAHGRY
jgi:hypothetical protein